MVAFAQGLAWVVVAALVSGAGMGLLSPALTVVVQNSVPVARMGSATTGQQFDHSRSRARASNLAAPPSMSRLPLPLHSSGRSARPWA